jgi:glycine betaine/proline transport system permease protein
MEWDFGRLLCKTLALVFSTTCLALIVGVPLGVWTANSPRAEKYFVLFRLDADDACFCLSDYCRFVFRIGSSAGSVCSTIIFAMPPWSALLDWEFGIVPKNVVEASRSFGATRWQLLYKVQLPLALPTILTGVNQTIMMSLSMVVIAAMIAAVVWEKFVVKGITQMKIGLGFEGGIAVVFLAIILDRIHTRNGRTKK